MLFPIIKDCLSPSQLPGAKTYLATVIAPLNGLQHPLRSLRIIDQRVAQGSMNKLEMLSFRPSEDGFLGRHDGIRLVVICIGD